MPSFSYTIAAQEERSALASISLPSENSANIGLPAGPFKASAHTVGPFGSVTKLERIATRHGVASENAPSPQKSSPGQTETEAAVEAAVALLEKCAIAARARSTTKCPPEEEAEAAEESAVALVRACASAAVKHSGRREPLSKRDATKLMLQARVADLEKEITTYKSKLEEPLVASLAEQCTLMVEQALHGYELKVEPFLRRAQNPFEPKDQHSLQVRLTELEQRIVESKGALRKKLQVKQEQGLASLRAEYKEQLCKHEAATHGLVGELTGVLSSHATRRKELEAELDQAVREHSEQALLLQDKLQRTIEENLRSRDELAAELATPLKGCDAKRQELELAVEELEAVLVMQ